MENTNNAEELFHREYDMDEIAFRGLPDVRDGLNVGQRNLLYAMLELGYLPDRPRKKIGHVGKLCFKGDNPKYRILTDMAQAFYFRYPLIDGEGKPGSIDSGNTAPMHYTKARLSQISIELMADIHKETVDFIPQYGIGKKPVALTSCFPNLLVNGASGMAMGMVSKIPPHNLREMAAAVMKMVDNKIDGRETSVEEIMSIVKAPDFPTGGIILGTEGSGEAYRTGHGNIRIRAAADIEAADNGRSRIVITELPYLVDKESLVQEIAEFTRLKTVDGITGLYDESGKDGMRIVIEVCCGADAKMILSRLYECTQLEYTFGVSMLALVDGQPKTMNLLDMLEHYIRHREMVVKRRIQYDLKKFEEKDHIVEGLLAAADNIDKVIGILRDKNNIGIARESLMELLSLTEIQACAATEMRVRGLTRLDYNRLKQEHLELQEAMRECKTILSDRKLLLGNVKAELKVISDMYGDKRRSRIALDYE